MRLGPGPRWGSRRGSRWPAFPTRGQAVTAELERAPAARSPDPAHAPLSGGRRVLGAVRSRHFSSVLPVGGWPHGSVSESQMNGTCARPLRFESALQHGFPTPPWPAAPSGRFRPSSERAVSGTPERPGRCSQPPNCRLTRRPASPPPRLPGWGREETDRSVSGACDTCPSLCVVTVGRRKLRISPLIPNASHTCPPVNSPCPISQRRKVPRATNQEPGQGGSQ